MVPRLHLMCWRELLISQMLRQTQFKLRPLLLTLTHGKKTVKVYVAICTAFDSGKASYKAKGLLRGGRKSCHSCQAGIFDTGFLDWYYHRDEQ
jgi:hypothetical protein